MQGTMLWFNPAKRHGIITTDEGDQLRVDEEGFAVGQVLGERCRGIRVTFDCSDERTDDARAVNVAIVPLGAARRARTRGYR